MPADSKTETTNTEGEGTAPDEAGFWNKLTEVVRGEVKAELDERVKNSKPTGTSRTGRKTLPDFLADIMFPQS